MEPLQAGSLVETTGAGIVVEEIEGIGTDAATGAGSEREGGEYAGVWLANEVGTALERQ